MKESQLLFTGPMVRALLDGRKTQTRRIVKPQPEQRGTCGPTLSGVPAWYWSSPRYDNGDGVHYFHTDEEAARRLMVRACPYGVPGDRLWVRETFQYESRTEDFEWNVRDCIIRYRATEPDAGPWIDREDRETNAWRPSIHMPRWASRLTLEVTGVRVERVKGISQADAKAEGLSTLTKDGGQTWKWGIPDRDGLPGTDNDGWEWRDWSVDPRIAYRRLWESINGPASWDANPWVWVIEFKRLEGAA